MHQESPKGSNFSTSNKLSQNPSATRYALDSTKIVNIQHATTSRCSLAGRSTVAYGCVSQTSMSPSVLSSVTPLKTPFSIVKGGVHTTMSPLVPTIPNFSSPNKKITIPNIVKPPPTQKVKVEVKEEVVEEDPSLLRERILQTYFDSVEEIKCNFKEKLQELFFVQSGGNMVDYPAWKQRPNPHLLSFLNIYRLDDTTTLSTPTATNTVSPSIKMQATYSNPAGSGNMSQLASPYTGPPNQTYSSYSEVSKNLPQIITTTVAQYGFVQTSYASSSKKTCSSSSSTSCSIATTTPIKLEPSSSTQSIEVSSTDCKSIDTSRCTISTPPQHHLTPNSNNTTPNPPSSASQDDILGQVRHENDIRLRIKELRKSGLWSASRLPKVYEAPRKKSQWDFLLEEMQWLAADFTQEKKWKRSMAKKVSRSVMKFHQDKAAFQKKLKREENARLKRIAGGIAKEVKQFWRQIEKVACYKQQSRQEEQRRKALDLHLNFIVGQTEKYSSWLAEGMKDASTVSSTQVSDGDDDEFEPDSKDAVDDEATIAEEESLAEEDGKKEDRYQEELEALKEESEIPMEDLLKTLPSDMLARIAGTNGDGDAISECQSAENEEVKECLDSQMDVREPEAVSDEKKNEETEPDEKEVEEEEAALDVLDANELEENNIESGDEYVANQEEMEDDENTIEEEEEMDGEVDHQAELDELQNEADMPIEELRKMYGVTGTGPVEAGDDSDDDEEEEEGDVPDEDSGTEYESESEESVSEAESDVSVKPKQEEKEETTAEGEDVATPNKEDGDKGEKSLYSNQQLTDAAAAAESLQPKGTTLSTQQVKTKVPFLLRHTLREYQHIGLDWLVTMYQKQLNGILADEMGLGKTIQTIALLAHLACEEEIWGPHLIVVPTSVILNWEFEFKKWCPGFKILSYFGNQKERKLKRTGWMKPNAFHVCITSYNLVIQDHQAFRRRKWKYLILDEAQNIKNFKSQRWQMLLNFNSQRRLLLTGTPLQNHLMELWSLMHFLMPNIFNSHQDFKEWFANPLTGMVEGNTEYNEELIKRLHTVLRPFLLRRLKAEVELQMPKKYEHVVKCRLSKRQRFLYDEFMSRTKTKETLEAGNFLSVINILMQLRKVCNHPDLFELRPTVSPYIMDKLTYNLPSLINDSLIDQQPLLGHCLAAYELTMCAFQAYRTRQLKVHKSLLQNLRDGLENELLASRRSSSPSDLTSSSFQPLSNVAGDYNSGPGGVSEAERSYFDCIAPSITTIEDCTIGDILTRQIQQSLEADIEVDVEGGETATDADKTPCPAAKKPRLSISSRNSLTANINNLNHSRQSALGNENTTGSETCDGLDSDDDDDGEGKEEPKCTCPDVNNHSCGRGNRGGTKNPGDGNAGSKGYTISKNRVRKRNKTRSGLLLGDYVADEVSPFHLPSLKDANEEQTNSRCSYMAETNERHCEAAPVYGLDLHRALQVCRDTDTTIVGAMLHQVSRRYFSSVLEDAIKTPNDRLVERKNLTDRFLLYVYPLLSQDAVMKTSHSVPWRDTRFKHLQTELNSQVRSKFNILAPMVTHSRLQFPETRLVQYDCGKLQTLDLLLRQLKAGKHRALIFTQMSRMLDVLERFLNYHGFIYLRLDGSTKVDQRQILMERFNKDEKIFCFILSTRSGGMGVNLTGADTVIFYDSDWNPTMDAQAQDRCHRIGQTRDVHIYRLISDKTVEENILKKAQNKRILGNIAIEGGNFTAAYFKQTSLKELFDTSSSDDQPSTSQQLCTTKTSSEPVETSTEESAKDQMKSTEYEEVLAKVEEEDDAKAAERAKIEQDCELAEFNDNVPENAGGDESKVEKALAHLESELKPIERFALKFMELTQSFHVEDEVEETEKMLALKKKEWELDHLQSMKEEEEKKHMQEDDEMFYTYARDETYAKVSPNKKDTKSSRRKSRKKTVEEEVAEEEEEEEEEEDKEVHNRIKPLIMQLGADRIAEIKKVAQEAIQAKTIQSSSDLVKMRVRKKPEFFNSGSSTPEPGSQPTEYFSASPSPPVASTSAASRTDSPDSNNLQSGLDLVKMRVRKKAEFFDAGSCTPTSPPPKPFLPQSPTPASKKLKINQKAKLALEKAKTGSLKANRGGMTKGGSQGAPKQNKQSSKTITSPTRTHQVHSGKPLNKPNKNAQRQPKTGAAKIHPLPKSNCAVKLKDYSSKPQSNDTNHSSTPNHTNDLSVNGIVPFADNNNIPHDSLSQWNGIMSGGPFTSVPSFHASYPTQNNAPSVLGKAPLNNTADHLHRYLSSANDHIGGYSNATTNFHHNAAAAANSHLLPTKALHLSQLSSTASSPLHSPASSSDSGGDVRRSSRTPRPKTYDNNDWFLFS